MLNIIVLIVVLSVTILAFRAECRYTDGNYSELNGAFVHCSILLC
jgi:hypothetical protein